MKKTPSKLPSHSVFSPLEGSASFGGCNSNSNSTSISKTSASKPSFSESPLSNLFQLKSPENFMKSFSPESKKGFGLNCRGNTKTSSESGGNMGKSKFDYGGCSNETDSQITGKSSHNNSTTRSLFTPNSHSTLRNPDLSFELPSCSPLVMIGLPKDYNLLQTECLCDGVCSCTRRRKFTSPPVQIHSLLSPNITPYQTSSINQITRNFVKAFNDSYRTLLQKESVLHHQKNRTNPPSVSETQTAGAETIQNENVNKQADLDEIVCENCENQEADEQREIVITPRMIKLGSDTKNEGIEKALSGVKEVNQKQGVREMGNCYGLELIHNSLEEEFCKEDEKLRSLNKKGRKRIERKRGRKGKESIFNKSIKVEDFSKDVSIEEKKGERYIRKRKRKSKDQLSVLTVEFEYNTNWNKHTMLEVASRTGLSEAQVYKWGWDMKRKKNNTSALIDQIAQIDLSYITLPHNQSISE
jgi:hypothetical protein